jgi:hypothetical protein
LPRFPSQPRQRQKPTPPPDPGAVVVVVVVGGVVGVVVVGGGEVVGVVDFDAEVVGVVVGDGEVVGVVVGDGEVVGVVVFPLVAEVPGVDGGVGVVVTPEGAGVELWAGCAVTTTDHLPHVSLTLPLTCPPVVSPENQ